MATQQGSAPSSLNPNAPVFQAKRNVCSECTKAANHSDENGVLYCTEHWPFLPSVRTRQPQRDDGVAHTTASLQQLDLSGPNGVPPPGMAPTAPAPPPVASTSPPEAKAAGGPLPPGNQVLLWDGQQSGYFHATVTGFTPPTYVEVFFDDIGQKAFLDLSSTDHQLLPELPDAKLKGPDPRDRKRWAIGTRVEVYSKLDEIWQDHIVKRVSGMSGESLAVADASDHSNSMYKNKDRMAPDIRACRRLLWRVGSEVEYCSDVHGSRWLRGKIVRMYVLEDREYLGVEFSSQEQPNDVYMRSVKRFDNKRVRPLHHHKPEDFPPWPENAEVTKALRLERGQGVLVYERERDTFIPGIVEGFNYAPAYHWVTFADGRTVSVNFTSVEYQLLKARPNIQLRRQAPPPSTGQTSKPAPAPQATSTPAATGAIPPQPVQLQGPASFGAPQHPDAVYGQATVTHGLADDAWVNEAVAAAPSGQSAPRMPNPYRPHPNPGQ